MNENDCEHQADRGQSRPKDSLPATFVRGSHGLKTAFAERIFKLKKRHVAQPVVSGKVRLMQVRFVFPRLKARNVIAWGWSEQRERRPG
ncbi:MAG TPA: hypothetical protein VN873_19530 [Candidatus Angelobacter sp.]|nr:hypothetical protein [Candidatus Angelobacter sp.]